MADARWKISFGASALAKLGRAREPLPLYEAISFYSVPDPILAPIAYLRKGVWMNCERA